MGFGGALIWTGLVRNLKNKYPDKKIILLYRRSLLNYILRKHNSDHVIYHNNTDIGGVFDHITWQFKKRQFDPKSIIVVDMSNSQYLYCSEEKKDRFCYKVGRHAIQIACDVHGIANAELRPKITLSKEEVDAAKLLLSNNGLLENQYICIEPHTKKDIMPNKAWFWENWQRLVSLTNKYIYDNQFRCKIVQVGASKNKILDGVVNLTGKTSFRQVAHILKNSITFVGCVGGLAHLTKAVGKTSIVLISAWEPLELASYPEDINFYTDIDCKNCGLKIPCPIDRKCMSSILVDQVFDAVKSMLKKMLS